MSDKIVEEHRKMVIVSGKISDFQLNNLKNYPFIVLGDYLKDAQIDYSFIRPGAKVDPNGLKMEDMYAGEIKYTFTFKEEPKYTKEELANRLGQLISWVKYLFWVNTTVKFYRDGKEWVI